MISGNGGHDVLKHTVDVGPMEQVSIEFAANAEKDWLFHCHNLYHAKTGMSRVVRYNNYNGNPTFHQAMKQSRDIKDTDWYQRTDLKLFNDYAQLNVRYSNYRYALELEAEKPREHETETELMALRRLSRWSQLYLAGVYEAQTNDTEYKLGLRYHAPFNIEVDTWLNSDNELHMALETAFQLTTHWQLMLEAGTENEYETYLSWRNSPKFSIAVGATAETDIMIGVTATF